MEGVFHGDDFISIPLHLLLGIFASQLHRSFIGFGSAIAEEDFIGEGVLTEEGGQLDLWFDIVEV